MYSEPIWLSKDDFGNVKWVTKNYIPASNTIEKPGSAIIINNKSNDKYIWLK